MKQIKDKKLNFMDFYKELCTLLNEDGTLRNVIIKDCIISNIPSHYCVIQLRKKWGRGKDRFCGFEIEGVRIEHNIFVPTKGGKISYDVPKNLIVYEVENLHPKNLR